MGLREPQFVTNEVHQVFGIARVVDRKIRVQPDLLGVVTQEPGADAVEGAGPGKQMVTRSVAQGLPADALHPVRHLGGGSPREGHQENAVGVCTMRDEMGHPMGEGVGFPEPAPAMIRSGEAMVDRPSTTPCSTACRW